VLNRHLVTPKCLEYGYSGRAKGFQPECETGIVSERYAHASEMERLWG
jgi:hypothetical protein